MLRSPTVILGAVDVVDLVVLPLSNNECCEVNLQKLKCRAGLVQYTQDQSRPVPRSPINGLRVRHPLGANWRE